MMNVFQCSCLSPPPLIQLDTTVWDRAVASITMEELAGASDTWWQTYMSTMVTARAAGTFEMKNNGIPTIDAPLVTAKLIVIPPLDANE